MQFWFVWLVFLLLLWLVVFMGAKRMHWFHYAVVRKQISVTTKICLWWKVNFIGGELKAELKLLLEECLHVNFSHNSFRVQGRTTGNLPLSNVPHCRTLICNFYFIVEASRGSWNDSCYFLTVRSESELSFIFLKFTLCI